MDIGARGRSGRHRLDGGDVAVRPSPGGAPDHPPAPRARPGGIPAQRTRDPLLDTDAMGLRKFDIGLVPASVTPPRTWQRAAWFAVLSSAAVLVGLAFAAATLVGANTPEERIGVPGYPGATQVVTGFAPTAPADPAAAVGADEPAGARPPRSDAARLAGARPSAPPAPPPAPAAPGADAPSGPAVGAAVSTVARGAAPQVDGALVAARAERFYEQAVTATRTALALVADGFRADAEALLAGRFGDVAAIRVTEVSVDPATGVAVTTLHVTRRDGTTSTERRELVFSTTGDLLINAERPFGGA